MACDALICFDCKCHECMKPFPKDSKWELCEASKLYKGKLYITRNCDTCGEVILQAWVDRSEKRNVLRRMASAILEEKGLPINSYFLGKEKPRLYSFRSVVKEAYPGFEVSGLSGMQGDHCVLLYIPLKDEPDFTYSVTLGWSNEEEEYYLEIKPLEE